MTSFNQATPLSSLTTMAVGGVPTRYRVAETRDELAHIAAELSSSEEPWCVLAGGSNSIFSDQGFVGTVLLVRTSGISEEPAAGAGAGAGAETVRLRVEAGHTWDELVSYCVQQSFSGLEALSGIPGSVGAAPIQNIGAYGQEFASVLREVEFFDSELGEVLTLPADQLQLGYRTSTFKQGRRGVVLSVVIELTRSPLGEPLQSTQVADVLGLELAEQTEMRAVREAVLALRSAKGMVWSEGDTDSHGAGSFFVNPIVPAKLLSALPDTVSFWPMGSRDGVDSVKLSAAWLIEHVGVTKGYRLPGSAAAISDKHALAITNRGGATAEQVAELARFVQLRVHADTGILLHPEPILYGLEL